MKNLMTNWSSRSDYNVFSHPPFPKGGTFLLSVNVSLLKCSVFASPPEAVAGLPALTLLTAVAVFLSTVATVGISTLFFEIF